MSWERARFVFRISVYFVISRAKKKQLKLGNRKEAPGPYVTSTGAEIVDHKVDRIRRLSPNAFHTTEVKSAKSSRCCKSCYNALKHKLPTTHHCTDLSVQYVGHRNLRLAVYFMQVI